MKILNLVILISILSTSCTNSSNSQRTYTEEELKKAVNDAKYDQRMADVAEQIATEERRKLEQERVENTPPAFGDFYFGVIWVSYDDYLGKKIAVYTTDIKSSRERITKDQEYMLLDQLSQTFRSTRSIYNNFKVTKRKVLHFINYAQASEAKEDILSEY